MRIIMFGPPGVGKGTVTDMIVEGHKLVHVSTGDLLRNAANDRNEFGLRAKVYMDKGDLVPDQLVVDILKERIRMVDCQGGYILDGFPRDIEQGKMLDSEGIKFDKVVDLVADDRTVTLRISSRRTCPHCNAIYNNITLKPKVEGTCDNCNTPLIHRDDDQVDAIKHRLDIYREKTAPLIDFYKEKGILVEVDASPNTPKEVFERVISVLKFDD